MRIYFLVLLFKRFKIQLVAEDIRDGPRLRNGMFFLTWFDKIGSIGNSAGTFFFDVDGTGASFSFELFPMIPPSCAPISKQKNRND